MGETDENDIPLNVDEKILTAYAADREFCAKFR